MWCGSKGVILPGGTLLAGQIFRLDGQNGFPFQFSGVVQQMGEATWVISGQAVAVDEQTALDEGIGVDDVVTVRGRVLPNGSWWWLVRFGWFRNPSPNLP